MSQRIDELAEREALLRLRCAAQRIDLSRQVDSIEGRLNSIDHAVATARGFLRNPAIIAGGSVLMMLLGRTRIFRFVTRGLVLTATVRRLLRFVKL